MPPHDWPPRRREPPPGMMELLQQMKDLRAEYDAGKLDVDDLTRKMNRLDRKFTSQLQNTFNEDSGLLMSRRHIEWRHGGGNHIPSASWKTDDIIREIRLSYYDRIVFPPGMSMKTDDDIFYTYRIDGLLSRVPGLENLDLEQSLHIVQHFTDKPFAASPENFASVDPKLLLLAALSKVDAHRDEAARQFPELYKQPPSLKNEKVTYGVINTLLQEAEIDPAFQSWEEEKRKEIVAKISADPDLMHDLAQVKAPININNENDLLQQYRLQGRILDRMAAIYGETYGVPISPDDAHIVYMSIGEVRKTGYAGTASGGIAMSEDNYIILRNTPTWDFITSEPFKSDRAAMADYTDTVSEELRHLVDLHYADKFFAGELAPDHPAFRHSLLASYNVLNYQGTEPAYYRQYVERTAKASADFVQGEIAQAVYPMEHTHKSVVENQQTPGTPEGILPPPARVGP